MEIEPLTRHERNKNGHRGIVKFTSKYTGRVNYMARTSEGGVERRSRRFPTIEEAIKAWRIMVGYVGDDEIVLMDKN